MAEQLVALGKRSSFMEQHSRKTIAASMYSFDHLIRYHLASMVMLGEKGIIKRENARAIIKALFEIRELGPEKIDFDPSMETIHPTIEKLVIEKLGADAGGDIAIGRARYEFGYVAEMLANREDSLEAMACLSMLDKSLRGVAGRTLDALAPYYTLHMRAEPITFGYYFASINEGVQQNLRRLRQAYGRMDRSNAGIGHIVPSALGFDRVRLGELLGFPTVGETSLYLYFNVDVAIDMMGSLALTATNIGRFCLDLSLWTSSDLGLVRFGDLFSGVSFVMPHKRNPSFLKPIQHAVIHTKTVHGQALEIYSHTTPMKLTGLVEIPGLLHGALDEMRFASEFLSGAIDSVEVDRVKGKALAEADFTQSAQLVHLLIDQHGASWRSAEQIVGKLVKEILGAGQKAQDIKPEALSRLTSEALGRKVEVTPESLHDALDALAIVKTRGDSGPAPEAVAEILKKQEATAKEMEAFVAAEKAHFAQTWKRLDEVAKAL